MCRFNAAACPANWTQYKNFSTTVGKTCQIGYTMQSGTYNCPAVITGDHAWVERTARIKAYLRIKLYRNLWTRAFIIWRPISL